MFLSYQKSINNGNYTSKLFDPSAYGDDLPESIDWRSKGAVASVKNQVTDIAHTTISPLLRMSP